MLNDIKPHLVELRKRLAISVGTIFVMFVLSFTFHEPILSWIIQPLNDALVTTAQSGNVIEEGKITTTQVGGAFFVALKVAFFSALMLSIPIILLQLWLFIAPGLYAHEKKLVVPFVVGGTVMFVTGALFAYYIVTPFGFTFLITFGSSNFIPYINIEDYVGFFTKIMMGFGVAFEMPIVILFLAIMGLVTDQSLKDFFKYAVLIIFVFAALLTPPDILTQLLMAGPLIILYGVSIIIAGFINPAKVDDDDEHEPESDKKTQEPEQLTK